MADITGKTLRPRSVAYTLRLSKPTGQTGCIKHNASVVGKGNDLVCIFHEHTENDGEPGTGVACLNV